ncbi:hypothetical protein [Limnohabitans sp. Rim8]
MNYKHRPARHWAWFANLRFSGDLGLWVQLPGLQSASAGQVVLL